MHPWFLVGYILHSVLWVPLGYLYHDSMGCLEIRKNGFSMDFLCYKIELCVIFQM